MGQENRLSPRFPFQMNVYLPSLPGRTLRTADLSAGGAYIVGDIGANLFDVIYLRLELARNEGGRERLYPLDAEVKVVRLSRDEDGRVAGCGVQWISVACDGNIAPLRHFLKAILCLESGFVQALRPEEGTPSFVFVFPQREPGGAGGPQASGQGPSVRPRTGVYVLLALTYQFGDLQATEGRAVKLMPHAMRISTSAELPEPYRRVTVHIPIKDNEKTGVLDLVGTVTSVRRGTGDGQFEVEFSLGNDPEVVASYRRMVENISQSVEKPT